MSDKQSAPKNKVKVFYDGACGLCSREINHYKSIAPKDVFEWVDITEDSSSFEALGYKKQDGLKALHVMDKNKNIQIGVDAFATIWRELTGWQFLAFIVRLPVINQIANWAYLRFAAWRFKRLGYENI